MTFWCGSGSDSGSAGPCLWLMDPDPTILIIDQQKTTVFFKRFSAHYFLNVHLHHSSKIKSQKDVTKQEELRFFLLFLLDDRIRSRTISPTNGSGSRRTQKHTNPTDPDPQQMVRLQENKLWRRTECWYQVLYMIYLVTGDWLRISYQISRTQIGNLTTYSKMQADTALNLIKLYSRRSGIQYKSLDKLKNLDVAR